MAYYDALITKWATLTPGTTAQKLAQINALTLTGSIPTTFFLTGNQIFNCLDWAEFSALTPTQQTLMMQICAIPGSIKGGTGSFFAGMIPVFYAGKLAGPTVTAFIALAQATTQPWWQATVAQNGGGLSSLVSVDDLKAAGNLT